jgi:tyrosinase
MAPPATFTSAPLALPPTTGVKPFYRADLLFYDVDQTGASYRAAVFFDNPGANQETPEDAEHGFAGSFSIFGKGGCFGDEGHCIPRGPQHRFDRRPPHPALPTLKVVRVTDAVQALLARGLTQTTVTLVPTLADTAGVQIEGDFEHPIQFSQLGLVTYDK